jgi:hypothetical protein
LGLPVRIHLSLCLLSAFVVIEFIEIIFVMDCDVSVLNAEFVIDIDVFLEGFCLLFFVPIPRFFLN